MKAIVDLSRELCYTDCAETKWNRARDFYFRTRFLTNSITLLGAKSAYFLLRPRAAISSQQRMKKVGAFFVAGKRMKLKPCKTCGTEFRVYPSTENKKNYCSLSCRSKGSSNPKWKGGLITRPCEICGEPVTVKPSHAARGFGRFCSRKCMAVHKASLTGENSTRWQGGKVNLSCKLCGKIFSVRQYRAETSNYCSYKCSARAKPKGPDAFSWLGGKSFEPYPPTFNNSFKRAIRERDNYTCAICGKYGKCVHHIDYNKENTTPENCITLCNRCHPKTNINRDYWQKRLSDFVRILEQGRRVA